VYSVAMPRGLKRRGEGFRHGHRVHHVRGSITVTRSLRQSAFTRRA